MEEFVKIIVDKLHSAFGVTGVITLGIVVAITVISWKILYMAAKMVIRGDIPEFVLTYVPFLRRIVSASIKKHTVFDRYNTIFNKIHYADIECPLRKRIFSRLMLVRAEHHKEQLEQFVESGIENLDSYTMKIKLEAFLVKSHDAWINDKRLAGLPKIVFRRFEEQTRGMKIFVKKLLIEFCDSNTISGGSIGRINQILDTLVVLEDSVLIAIEEVVDQLNGDISNITFEGEVCHNCDEACEFKALKGSVSRESYDFNSVLVVDDDDNTAAMIKKAFKKFGVEVYVAKNLATAIEAIESIKIDVAILDYYLANNNYGTDLEHILQRKRIPFIIFTGADPQLVKTSSVIVPKNARMGELCEKLNKMVVEGRVESTGS